MPLTAIKLATDYTVHPLKAYKLGINHSHVVHLSLNSFHHSHIVIVHQYQAYCTVSEGSPLDDSLVIDLERAMWHSIVITHHHDIST